MEESKALPLPSFPSGGFKQKGKAAHIPNRLVNLDN